MVKTTKFRNLSVSPPIIIASKVEADDSYQRLFTALKTMFLTRDIEQIVYSCSETGQLSTECSFIKNLALPRTYVRREREREGETRTDIFMKEQIS